MSESTEQSVLSLEKGAGLNGSQSGENLVTSPDSCTGWYNQVKLRVHTLLDEPDPHDPVAIIIQVIIAGAILINTGAIILFTVHSINVGFEFLLNPVISICISIFTIEYLLRLWSCTIARDMKGMVRDRIRYALHLYQIIDLVSIIPFLFPYVFPRHLTLLRTFRIVSIFKLARYSRYSKSLDQLKRVLLRKREVFVILIFFLIFVVLFSSTIMYVIEYPVQPDKFSSIPAAMWWSVMTVTTVGYGDMVPVTPLGKLIGSLFTVTGVLVLALPSAILATGFIEEREKEKSSNRNPAQVTAYSDMVRLLGTHHERGVITDQEYAEYMAIAMRMISEK